MKLYAFVDELVEFVVGCVIVVAMGVGLVLVALGAVLDRKGTEL